MKTLITATALLLVGVTAFAAPAAKPAAKPKTVAKPAAQKWPTTCPITGEPIASAADAAGHSTYKGKTYYFCCASCKPMFDKNPAKYVKPAAGKPASKPMGGMKM